MTWRSTIFGIFVASLISCGGGGGGGAQLEVPARLEINAFPRRIDSGDRISVSVDIREVTPLGIALKVRFPTGLSYVAGSSFLFVGEEVIDVGPTENVSVGSDQYLVYYFSQDIFDLNGRGELSFVLTGTTEVAKGDIEVDADIDDPAVANTAEFDSAEPRFDMQDLIRIEVIGEAEVATPTPTVTPSS